MSNETAKRESHIPLVKITNGDVLPDSPYANIVLSSADRNWPNLVVEEHHLRGGQCEMDEKLMYVQHVLSFNLGGSITSEVKQNGRSVRTTRRKGAISLFPSRRPIFGRVNRGDNGSADLLYLALDPVFVSRTAEDIEVYPDRLEFVEQRQQTDPALWHIAMALRAGVRSAPAPDSMYGEALSNALAVHLLRRYCGTRTDLKHPENHSTRGLSIEKLRQAKEFIQDHLSTELTVAGIASSVHMSPYHFTRLFKKSTGRSPYQYVVESRARRAKELLLSGKYSIAEIAYRLGYADQSHLTRHLKQAFGMTPKGLQTGRHSEQQFQ